MYLLHDTAPLRLRRDRDCQRKSPSLLVRSLCRCTSERSAGVPAVRFGLRQECEAFWGLKPDGPMSGLSPCEECDVRFGPRIHGLEPDFTPPVSGSGPGFMGSNRTCFGATTAMSGLGPRPRARTGHRNVRFEPSHLHCPVWAPDSWARTGRARTGHRHVRFEP